MILAHTSSGAGQEPSKRNDEEIFDTPSLYTPSLAPFGQP